MRLHGTHFVAAVAAARNGWRHADGAPVIDHRSSGWSCPAALHSRRANTPLLRPFCQRGTMIFMTIRSLPPLSPSQVVQLQDALLANADRLLVSALTILDSAQVALARSLAILGMEESGKAIALHERRVAIAYEPEGTPFG